MPVTLKRPVENFCDEKIADRMTIGQWVWPRALPCSILSTRVRDLAFESSQNLLKCFRHTTILLLPSYSPRSPSPTPLPGTCLMGRPPESLLRAIILQHHDESVRCGSF